MNKRRWKGKFISEKQYEKKKILVQIGKNSKKNKEEIRKISSRVRMIDVDYLSNHLFCTFCNETLSLSKIEKEKRRGFGSIFTIRCDKCSLARDVPTGQQHEAQSGRLHFDINTKAALGAIHAGLGAVKINNFSKVMDIPEIGSNILKRHEREIGPMVEHIAKKSCHEACAIERALTLKNLESLNKLLPDGVERDFLTPGFPNSPDHYDKNSVWISPYIVSSSREGSHCSNSIIGGTDPNISNNNNIMPTDNNTNSTDNINNFDTNILHKDKHNSLHDSNNNSTLDRVNSVETTQTDKKNDNPNTVRIFTSFDTAWSTRGSGRQYDSLNGYSSLIGKESGLVLDYTSQNRKCRRCDLGHRKDDHDCRKNFYGTAKAMEPDMAAQLVLRSSNLKDNNLEVGVFIGDNDSSSICAIRKESNYTVLKQSDKNHTSKGVTNLLYKIGRNNDPNREMNGEAIKYFHRCFTYAMSQNQGNKVKMAEAIRNIPFHAFNFHENCGTWCRYITDKENYRHSVVKEGFKSLKLFEALKTIFNGLAKNADSFVMGASTQANESLNASMTRKTPKCDSYSSGEIADFRLSSVVVHKNVGERYISDVLTNYGLDVGSALSKNIETITKAAQLRALKSKTPQFKLKRQNQRKERSQLRSNKEQKEGTTYKSNIGLTENMVPPDSITTGSLSEHIEDPVSQNNHAISLNNLQYIFFDIETGGFSLTADVLQIAMKSKNNAFNMYLNPTQGIPHKASEINHLTNVNGELHYRGEKIVSYPIRVTLFKLLEYLQRLNKKCVLVAHNCTFDAPRLLRIIQEANLIDEFREVILGFVDTLKMFRKKFPERRSKGLCTLTALCSDTLQFTSNDAHNAFDDVVILEKLVTHHFNDDDLLEEIKYLGDILELPYQKAKIEHNMETLTWLKNVISKPMIKKLAKANITYNTLLTTYAKGEDELIALLEQRIDGKSQVIKTKKILDSILDHLKQST